MATTLTFKDVCDVIKKKHPQDQKLIDAVDKLLGISMILSPVVFGQGLTRVLSCLFQPAELVVAARSTSQIGAGRAGEAGQ